MLFDSNSLIYRAYFALINTPLTTSKGQLVNAVFGFWSIVLRGFQDVKPDYVIAAFDLSGPTFRHEQYTDYKATRRQMPDDLQATSFRSCARSSTRSASRSTSCRASRRTTSSPRWCARRRSRDVETTIVSGDLDLLQLVSDRTTLMSTRGGVQQTVYYDPATGHGALRPAAGADDRLQGAQGRHDRQHPGHSRRRREDRRQAGHRLRLGRRHLRQHRLGHCPRSCA